MHAVAAGAAPAGLVGVLYEVADDRDLPDAARGEDGRMAWRRARHRLREPETPVDRASDAEIVALLRACRSARDRLLVTSYLDDLLRTRERLAATIDGIDEWARADATPTTEEITRIRRLIHRINGDIAGVDAVARAQIDDAVAVVRRHRAAHTVVLGLPTIRAAAPAPMTAPSTAPEATA